MKLPCTIPRVACVASACVASLRVGAGSIDVAGRRREAFVDVCACQGRHRDVCARVYQRLIAPVTDAGSLLSQPIGRRVCRTGCAGRPCTRNEQDDALSVHGENQLSAPTRVFNVRPRLPESLSPTLNPLCCNVKLALAS
eukprot:752819-Hanusia_phi.AAC.5